MKPQQDNDSGGGGGSRAAKKRAKKKHKNKQPSSPENETALELVAKDPTNKKRPLEEKAADSQRKTKKDETTKKPSSLSAAAVEGGGAGILKKPKYPANAVAGSHQKAALSSTTLSASIDHHEKDAEEAAQEEIVDDMDVAIPEDILEFVKSQDTINLKDILLRTETKKKAQQTASKQKSTKNNDNMEEEESEEDEGGNPFQDLTSKQRARCAMNFLLAPANISAEDFYEEYWEKKALCVQACNNSNNKQQYRHRLDGFLSLKSIRQWTKKHVAYYGRDLNVTRYHTVQPGQPKRRANIDPPPFQDAKTGDPKYVQMDSDFVWENFDEKQATIRLLCPHKHNDDIHALLSLFELEWGCMVGANAYLTPPGGSQGFAPHWDDIEAFCLQLEGRKRWKVYAPDKETRLPRVSSEDFTDEDMMEKEPVLDVVLEPGDLLYMPRGWIHQGITLPGNEHSLHLTMSAMQQWAWVDYLELLIPNALEAAANSETSISLRKGLPRNFLDYMGAMHDERDDDKLPDRLKQGGGAGGTGDGEEDDISEEDKEELKKIQRIRTLQENFREDAKKRIMRVAKEAMDMVDAACDQIGKRFMSDRLPPGLTAEELACTSEGQKDAKIWPTTLCRLARPGIARLVLEDGKAILYHCAENSRVFHEVPVSPMEFEVDDAPSLEQLITTVEPNWIPVSELIHEGMEDKIAITQALYDEGILAIINPDGDPVV